MASRVIGAILALLVLAIIAMAVVENRNRVEDSPKGVEILESVDSTDAEILNDSLPVVDDGRALP
jgi:hypothetical protein